MKKTIDHGCTHGHSIEIPEPDPKNRTPSTNEIVQFFHCGSCLFERPPGTSPREWARLEVGMTPAGLQVWCKRCEANVCHIDFEGHTHPANLKRETQG